jgi:hypothetical protein
MIQLRAHHDDEFIIDLPDGSEIMVHVNRRIRGEFDLLTFLLPGKATVRKREKQSPGAHPQRAKLRVFRAGGNGA